MLKRTMGAAVILLLVVGGVVAMHPAIRAKVTQQYNRVTGWDEDARQADPVGYVNHVEAKLNQDLEELESTRRELSGNVGDLSETIREKLALSEQNRERADEFRQVYQAALKDDAFPVELYGQAYTENQVVSQVSMLLAEADACEQCVDQMEQVQEKAQQRIEELAIQIGRTESQLAMIDVKRDLLQAERLTGEGEQMFAQVDELMIDNMQLVKLIDSNPVRTGEELELYAQQNEVPQNDFSAVEQYLAVRPEVKIPEKTGKESEPKEEAETVAEVDNVVVQPASSEKIEQKKQPVNKVSHKKQAVDKPIFQQS